MTAYATIAYDAARCEACGHCVEVCASAGAGADGVRRAPRLQVLGGDDGPAMVRCRQCADPGCVRVCPTAALATDPDSGVVHWDGARCVDCLLCTAGCVYGGIAADPVSGRVAKCDHCGGNPACVAACPTGALRYVTVSRIFNDQHDREDLFVPGLSACQGCNSELIMRHSLRRVGADTVLAAPPGCIPGMGSVGYNGLTGTRVPVFHPLLTNTASMLAGVKKYFDRIGRDVTVMALAGDGGAGDVGFQSLSGAAARNDPMLFVCVDNEGYMNTGMQASASTSTGSWTSTTPVGPMLAGKSGPRKDLALIMLGHDCEYVATASLAFMEDFHDKLERAIDAARRGMAYLHIYSPCPSGWRFPAALTIEVCRKSVETNFAPLWQYRRGGRLEFTRDIDRPLPVEGYLALSGKYRHLTGEMRESIQHQVDDHLTRLRRLAGDGEPRETHAS